MVGGKECYERASGYAARCQVSKEEIALKFMAALLSNPKYYLMDLDEVAAYANAAAEAFIKEMC